MGFEVKYLYYEKAETGYNVKEEKEFKAKVGDPFEDVPHENLAGAVMAQFARRDIMIFDAEIYELTKKKITFRETKGGVIIKKKKYSFDQGTKLHVQNVVDDTPPVASLLDLLPPGFQPTQNAVVPVPANIALPQAKPMRYEIFKPTRELQKEAKQRGLAFVEGHEYPIYEEKRAGDSPLHGMNYVTVDDKDQKQIIHANHFVPKSQGLIGDFKVDQDYGDGDNMPALR